MTTQRGSRAGSVAQGGRLITDALSTAVFGLAEALGAPSADPPEPPSAGPGTTAPNSDDDRDRGFVRGLAALPARAAVDAASAVAGTVVPAVVERVDLNAILAKVDVNALVARVDVDRVLDSIEPNRLLDRVDLDDLVQRVDVGAIAREAIEGVDVAGLVQESTASIASDTLDAIRFQGMRADDLAARVVDWALFRRRPRDTAVGGPKGRA